MEDSESGGTSPHVGARPPRPVKFRWRSLAAIVVLASAGQVVLQTVAFEDNVQFRIMGSTALAFLSTGSVAAHLLFFSGLHRVTRARLAAAGLAAVAGLAVCFRIGGFSGNVLPHWRWRFLDARAHLAADSLGSWTQTIDRHVLWWMAGLGSTWAVCTYFMLAKGKRRLPAIGMQVLSLGLASAGVERLSRQAVESLPAPAEATGEMVDLATTGPHDYPQFLGPNRNGVAPPVRLQRDWATHPPRLVWRKEVGAGWGAFAVVGDYAVTQERHDDAEWTVCYRLSTGATIWKHVDEGSFDREPSGSGPRATPTIDRGKVYSLSSVGVLSCLDGASGKVLWQQRTLDKNDVHFGNDNLEWGTSCSPSITDGLAIVSAGMGDKPSLFAFRLQDGEIAWRAENGGASYASPVVAELNGSRQVSMVNRESVTAHDIGTGKTLWTFVWPGQHPKVAQPVPVDASHVYVGAGYGLGSHLLEVKQAANGDWSVADVWGGPNLRLKPKFTNVILHRGHLLGLDDGRTLVAVDAKTGELVSRCGRYGHGQILLAGDLLIVQAEDGEVYSIDANPLDLRELGSFTALHGVTWNNPVLAGRFLLVRNASQAACYELPLEQ